MTDYDRIYDMLQRQGETLVRIDQTQSDMKERLFGANGQPGALHFMQTEIAATNTIVAKHGEQIKFWKGALSILSVLFTTALAWGGIVLGKRH